MRTIEEQITYLARQLNAMQTDVAELQNAPHVSATRYADLMVQLFTSEPRVRRVMEDAATAAVSRFASSGDEKHKCHDERRTEVQARKRQYASHRHGVARRAANRSQHARWNCRTGSDHCAKT